MRDDETKDGEIRPIKRSTIVVMTLEKSSRSDHFNEKTMSTDLSQSPEHATNNDVELRELVYQSLEREGILSRIRAQLRAAVFKTIEKSSNSPSDGSTTNSTSIDQRICRAVILDWLEQSRLLYTKDIFQMETSNSSATINEDELIEHLHLESHRIRTQPILQTLIHQRNGPTTITRTDSSMNVTILPETIKQSIDARFPTEKINDLNRVREHFRLLFNSSFDSVVLDAFLQKTLPMNSISKYDYEQLCLKWLQSCSKALNPITFATPSPAPVNNGQTVTRARRALSPTSDSSSSSSNTSDNLRQGQFPFSLPTTKKNEEIFPPKLSNLKRDDDDDDDTTSSIFSRKNATPAVLDRLKHIEDIAQGGGGGETPRTRTTVDKFSSNGNKDLPIEYDDESFSQSQMSSVDDVTVDKASPSPSAQIDFLEDL